MVAKEISDTVRLNEFEVSAICEVFRRYFRPEDHIWLFGSRVDKNKRGGDIDLYIETHYSLDEYFDRKLNFSVDLQEIIGAQKIDIIINGITSDHFLPIYEEARSTGIKLT